MAAAIAEVCRQFRARLEDGSLCDGLAAMKAPFVVGVGHSIGGALVTLAQAAVTPFDGVAILGMTAGEFKRHPHPTTGALRGSFRPDAQPGYVHPARLDLRHWFHYPDVPDDVLRAGRRGRDRATASGLGSVQARQNSGRGAAHPIAGLPRFREIDNAANSHEEVSAYSASPDVALLVLPRSGHCHNTASTRELLWQRIIGWAQLVHTSSAHEDR